MFSCDQSEVRRDFDDSMDDDRDDSVSGSSRAGTAPTVYDHDQTDDSAVEDSQMLSARDAKKQRR